MKTPKRMHAKKIAAELAHYWTLTNYTQRERGDNEYTLEWMLADAWLRGFEAGRRDEKQRLKEKNSGCAANMGGATGLLGID